MWGLVLGATLLAVSAEAGAKKNEDAIETTGIAMFDTVFAKVGPIDRTLSGVEGSLRTARTNLTSALDLQKGTPLKDALAELEREAGNQITLASRGNVPTLTAQDAMPSNVQSAIGAVNALTANLTSSLDDLQALPAQVDALITQTRRFPNQLRAEFAKGGTSLLDTLFAIPKASSALNHNLGIVTGLPDRTLSVTDRTTDILGVVSSTFSSRR
ncbi:MAG: hypothetical protein H0V89_12960 [Deltaproteobacteria bacterium]|nr:hypothetical protein [Deltaproteobacteria bacterium]